jgi:hypothetical protein
MSRSAALASPPALISCTCAIKSPFSGPWFAWALAGIRLPVVQIQAVEQDDLIQL